MPGILIPKVSGHAAGIPENISYNQFESTVASILSDIGVNIQSEEIEGCHRFGKTDGKTKSKKLFVLLIGLSKGAA